MVVEVFIAERDAKHPLPDQRPYRVDQILPAMIAKAICKAPHQIDRRIGRAQKQRAGIRRHRSSIKGRFHDAAFHPSKFRPLCATLSLHRGLFESSQSPSRKRTFADSAPRCA